MAARKRGSAIPRQTFGEFDAIALLRRTLSPLAQSASRSGAGTGPSQPGEPRLRVGIGDDAAVLETPGADLVWSNDASLEHVHFDLRYLSLECAAARAIHAAVSDLAAMGAKPLAALVALELPPRANQRAIAQIARGQAHASSELGCPIVGGNISRGVRYGFTTSVLGSTRRGRARLRSTARAGDEIWLSHSVGWAALGLRLFQDGRVRLGARGGLLWGELGEPRAGRQAVQAWQRPRAKLAEGLRWATRCSALIDVSDGLASDARHIAAASKRQLILDRHALWQAHHELCVEAATCNVSAEQLILAGGEDYALLATGPRSKRPTDAIVIGRVETGEPGVFLESESERQPVTLAGHDHLGR